MDDVGPWRRVSSFHSFSRLFFASNRVFSKIKSRLWVVVEHLHARNNDAGDTGIFVQRFVRQGKVEFDRSCGRRFRTHQTRRHTTKDLRSNRARQHYYYYLLLRCSGEESTRRSEDGRFNNTHTQEAVRRQASVPIHKSPSSSSAADQQEREPREDKAQDADVMIFALPKSGFETLDCRKK